MRLDTATLGFSGRKGRADIFWGREVSMGLFSPSESEKIFDTLDRARKIIFWDYMAWNVDSTCYITFLSQINQFV